MLAPDQDLIDAYRKQGLPYAEFAARFRKLLRSRAVEKAVESKLRDGDCLLCSEVNASECHRSVVATYLARHYKNVTVTDL